MTTGKRKKAVKTAAAKNSFDAKAGRMRRLADAIDAALEANLLVRVSVTYTLCTDPFDPVHESDLSLGDRKQFESDKVKIACAKAIEQRLRATFEAAKHDLSENEAVRTETDLQEFRMQLLCPSAEESPPHPPQKETVTRMAELSKRLRHRANVAQHATDVPDVMLKGAKLSREAERAQPLRTETVTFFRKFSSILCPFDDGEVLRMRASLKAELLRILFREWKKGGDSWLAWADLKKEVGITSGEPEPNRFFEDRSKKRPQYQRVFRKIIEQDKNVSQNGAAYMVRLNPSYSYVADP